MEGRDNLDQKFVDDAEASLMAALGISDTKEGAKNQGLADTDGKPHTRSNEPNTMDQNSDQDLAGLAEILPEVSVRKPEGGESPIEDENEAHIREDGVDSVTPHAEVEDNFKSKNIMNLGRTSMKVNAPRDVGETMHSSNKAVSRNVSEEMGVGDSSAFQGGDVTDYDEYPDSENALEGESKEDPGAVSKEFINSAQSISTATRQTHDVKMPMYLPNFKPATGCTNASDFIVRCFVARLRSGITVVKHGRSRWCKSRLRVLQIHPDGRSLSWKPAEGEPSSSKKPPRLDLTTCLEVRHAWSPDPQNPMYTGTPILRQKCEAANAHKSFALIFKNRTVDITGMLGFVVKTPSYFVVRESSV